VTERRTIEGPCEEDVSVRRRPALVLSSRVGVSSPGVAVVCRAGHRHKKGPARGCNGRCGPALGGVARSWRGVPAPRRLLEPRGWGSRVAEGSVLDRCGEGVKIPLLNRISRRTHIGLVSTSRDRGVPRHLGGVPHAYSRQNLLTYTTSSHRPSSLPRGRRSGCMESGLPQAPRQTVDRDGGRQCKGCRTQGGTTG
jgi:hypothetical protein